MLNKGSAALIVSRSR